MVKWRGNIRFDNYGENITPYKKKQKRKVLQLVIIDQLVYKLITGILSESIHKHFERISCQKNRKVTRRWTEDCESCYTYILSNFKLSEIS